MKFFLDENIPLSINNTIKNLGFKVEHTRNVGLTGSPDKEIAEYARKQNAILVTRDIEFGSRILYPKNSHYGLLILRLPFNFSAKQISENLKKFLNNINVEILVNSITILELGRYRRRMLF